MVKFHRNQMDRSSQVPQLPWVGLKSWLGHRWNTRCSTLISLCRRKSQCSGHESATFTWVLSHWSGFLSLKSVRLKTGAGGSIQSFSPNDRLVGFFKRPSRGNFDPVRFYLKACGVPLSEIAPEMNKYLAWNQFQRETSLYISQLVSPFSVATTRRLLNSMLPKSYLAARWEWENCKKSGRSLHIFLGETIEFIKSRIYCDFL